jgi:hypothetical protein
MTRVLICRMLVAMSIRDPQAESLVFDVPRVTLTTLKLALYYDLATEKDGDLV